jgi:hypothetical protein
MNAMFSVVLRQQMKSDVMTSFGHSTRTAIYYKAGSPLGFGGNEVKMNMYIYAHSKHSHGLLRYHYARYTDSAQSTSDKICTHQDRHFPIKPHFSYFHLE